MTHKKRPSYKAKYQMELAVELTGKSKMAIRKMMERKDCTLTQTIRYYLTGELYKAN